MHGPGAAFPKLLAAYSSESELLHMTHCRPHHAVSAKEHGQSPGNPDCRLQPIPTKERVLPQCPGLEVLSFTL